MSLLIYSHVLDMYISLQSCVTLQYILMILFLYSHVLHCNTYMYVTIKLQCNTYMYVTIYVLDMYVNI